VLPLSRQEEGDSGRRGKRATALETDARSARDKATRDELLAQEAAKMAQTETIRQGIYQAQTEFQISPVRGLLLTVEALDASKREQLKCGQQTC
jgi:hypothetical protein